MSDRHLLAINQAESIMVGFNANDFLVNQLPEWKWDLIVHCNKFYIDEGDSSDRIYSDSNICRELHNLGINNIKLIPNDEVIDMYWELNGLILDEYNEIR